MENINHDKKETNIHKEIVNIKWWIKKQTYGDRQIKTVEKETDI